MVPAHSMRLPGLEYLQQIGQSANISVTFSISLSPSLTLPHLSILSSPSLSIYASLTLSPSIPPFFTLLIYLSFPHPPHTSFLPSPSHPSLSTLSPSFSFLHAPSFSGTSVPSAQLSQTLLLFELQVNWLINICQVMSHIL